MSPKSTYDRAFALPVEFVNRQLSTHPKSPCSDSDNPPPSTKVFPPFVSVSLLAKEKFELEPAGSAKLNLHLSAVVGSMFSAGSVMLSKCGSSSDGLLF